MINRTNKNVNISVIFLLFKKSYAILNELKKDMLLFSKTIFLCLSSHFFVSTNLSGVEIILHSFCFIFLFSKTISFSVSFLSGKTISSPFILKVFLYFLFFITSATILPSLHSIILSAYVSASSLL